MFKFLLKGILRDRSRTVFPLITIAVGVSLIVFMWCWAVGVLSQVIAKTADLDLGHLKIVTNAYEEMIKQKPYDLCLTETDQLFVKLDKEFPEISYAPRTYFGGLIDLPDSTGNTISQSDFMGIALNLIHDRKEHERFNLNSSLIKGRLPENSEEILVSDNLFEKFNIELGREVSLITSTMYGSMSIRNYNIVGTVKFGVQALDRGAVMIDNSAISGLLDMENATGEVFCFLKDGDYDTDTVNKIKDRFNQSYNDKSDEFSPYMRILEDDETLGFMIGMTKQSVGIMTFGLMLMVAIVLWNSGLLNGIRRYGEIGVRLAIGESKKHVYLSMIYEAIILGVVGSILGTAIGLAISYYLQYHPIDISHYMKNSSIMMTNEFGAKVDFMSYVIGFIPGIIASTLGAVLAGRAIYKRQTSQLFKEME